jgi:polysaccharide export outer membrane protein
LFSLFFSVVLFAEENSEQHTQNQTSTSLVNQEYQLGSGDLLKITIFNQEDLSGEYTINGAGQISMPLIGDVNTKDLTVRQVQEAIANKLKPDYLLNPRVSVQVLNYRPFYILGEVKAPQSYPYVDGMTYLNAVAIAGGYTYRAKEDYVMVIRMNDPKKQELKLNMDEKVLPGDVIHVKERFF